MRKREIQSFTLKLNDLKEYDLMKQEKLASKPQEKASESPSSSAQPPIARVAPKAKQEIHERIGLNDSL